MTDNDKDKYMGKDVPEESKEYWDKWNANKGQFRDPEIARKAQLKSTETKRRQKAMKEKLANKRKFIDDALAAVTAEQPDFMEKIISGLLEIANNENTDPKDRLAALDRITEITGLKSPKQVETKVEEVKMTPEEAKKIVSSHFKVIKGGKG